MKAPCVESHEEQQYGLPSLEELGHDLSCLQEAQFPGGEEEALRRLEESMERTVRWGTKGGLSNHGRLIELFQFISKVFLIISWNRVAEWLGGSTPS